jgi:uncharacterized protein involved in exopolysaccharide biosynthesis
LDDDELSLVDLLIVLARSRRLLIGMPLLAALLAAVVVMLIPSEYKATTRILPPVVGQSASVAILAGVGGGIMGVGKNPSDIYVTLLKSHSVEDVVIQRFKLKDYYGKRYVEDTRKAFEKDMDAKAGKEGVIEISFQHQQPQTAAAIANGMVEALQEINSRLAITEAARRRVYFERQLVTVKQSLALAEGGLKDYQQSTGVIEPKEQAGATLGAMATLEATIAAKEVELGAMRTFATKQNPDFERVNQQLQELKNQLARLQNSSRAQKDAVTVSKNRLPEAGLTFSRKLRDVKYYETLYEITAKQYEMARADEAKEGTLIQVVDRAVPAERRAYPKRSMTVLLSAVVGLFLAILIAFVRNAIAAGGNDPRQAARMAELKRALGR